MTKKVSSSLKIIMAKVVITDLSKREDIIYSKSCIRFIHGPNSNSLVNLND